MLSVLIIQVLLSVICMATGFIFYHSTVRSQQKPLVFHFITGLIVLTVLTEIAALFFPIKLWYTATVFTLVVILLFVKRHSFALFLNEIKNKIAATTLVERLVYLFAWLLFAYLASGRIIMDDTESYHIQMIKWINEYGTTPGIANLHERYGFNSAWFSSVAFVNVFKGVQLYAVLNSVLTLWFCIYLFRKFRDADGNKVIAAAILLIITLAFWPLLRGNAVNANYDFITTLIVTILVMEMHQSKDFQRFLPELIIWPAFLITVRLMNFPLLILFFAAVVLMYRTKTSRLIALVFPVIIVLPFLIRSVMLTGYLFFPSPVFDVFDVDWKADPAMMHQLLDYIKYYNRVSTEFMEIEQTRALGNWIPAWYNHLYIHDKVIVASGIAGLLAAIIDLFNRKTTKLFRLTIVTLVVSVISWFVIAPDPRFIYGCLFAGTYLLFYKASTFISMKTRMVVNFVHIGFLIAVVAYIIYRMTQLDMTVGLIKTSALPEPPVTTQRIDSITLNIPSAIEGNWNPRCYATELPCVYKVDPRLEARGHSIADGFRLKK